MSRLTRSIVSLIALGGFALPLAAQKKVVATAVTEPKVPDDCEPWVAQEVAGKREALIETMGKEAGARAGWDSTASWETSLTATCARRFSVATIDKNQLVPLSRLYLRAKQWDQARDAVDKARKKLSGNDKAGAMVAALDVYLDGSRAIIEWRNTRPPAERVAIAEKIMADLEKMGNDASVQKVQGFEKMSKAYYEEGVDKVQRYLEKAVKTLNSVPAAARVAAPLRDITQGIYLELSKVHMYHVRPKEAMATIDAGIVALAADSNMVNRLEQANALYALVGKPAPAVSATNWFNRPAGAPESIDFKGKVTLVEFTAFWCGPCRSSYVPIIALHKQYAPKGFEVVIHTQLYGSDSSQAADTEIASDRKYFLEEHKMTFPVGIDTTFLGPSEYDPKQVARVAPASSKAYLVGGIPHLVLVDKSGIVRQVYVGWLAPDERSFFDTNKERVEALVNKLLAEPATH